MSVLKIKMSKKDKLQKLVTELYQECGQEICPLFPKVLVRLLPRGTETSGGIILPDESKYQNKPTHEAVVLKVYKPFFRRVWIEDLNWNTEGWDEDAKYMQKVECAVKPGDHILFPFAEFGITPVWPLDEGVGEYRLVPEQHITAVVEYDERPEELVSVTTSGR